MAQNRTIPYGYQIQNGTILPHPDESDIVRRIYENYIGGQSYKKIAESLTIEGVRYQSDKPTWNKNMVARILQNEHYRGSEKYPTIIEKELHRGAKLAQKPYTHTFPKTLKMLKPHLVCGICGSSIERRIHVEGRARWYCTSDSGHIDTDMSDQEILDRLLTLQQTVATCDIQPSQEQKDVSAELVKVRLEMDDLLLHASQNIAQLQQKLLDIAALHYTLCPDTTHLEQAVQEGLKEATTLQPKELLQLAQQIQLSHGQITGVTLRNGLTIQKGRDDHE